VPNWQREIEEIRTAYAKQVLAAVGVVDARLESAFGTTRREVFLGPGPWSILRELRDYELTPDADPVHVYTDDVIGILPERRLNNGQPSLHAYLIHHAAPVAGDRIVHIGTGTGYYTPSSHSSPGRQAVSRVSSTSPSLPREPGPISRHTPALRS